MIVQFLTAARKRIFSWPGFLGLIGFIWGVLGHLSTVGFVVNTPWLKYLADAWMWLQSPGSSNYLMLFGVLWLVGVVVLPEIARLWRGNQVSFEATKVEAPPMLPMKLPEPPAKPPPTKGVVIMDADFPISQTPAELVEIYRTHSSMDADALTEKFKNQPYKIRGPIGDKKNVGSRAMVSFEFGAFGNGRGLAVIGFFEADQIPKVKFLDQGSVVTVAGKIDTIEAGLLSLKECTIVHE